MQSWSGLYSTTGLAGTFVVCETLAPQEIQIPMFCRCANAYRGVGGLSNQDRIRKNLHSIGEIRTRVASPSELCSGVALGTW